MTEQPLTRRQVRELERRREHLAYTGEIAVVEGDVVNRTGQIEVVSIPEPNTLVVDSLNEVTNLSLLLPESGVTLKTGAIDLPHLKAQTGEVAIVEAAAQADDANNKEKTDHTVTGIQPVAARVHYRSRKKASVFPTRLRQGWGVVHLVLVSGFILLAIFLSLVAAVLLGVIKLY